MDFAVMIININEKFSQIPAPKNIIILPQSCKVHVTKLTIIIKVTKLTTYY